MLRKPVPTGVVIGAFRRTLGAADALHHAVGQRRAEPLHHVDAGLLHVPIDFDARGVDTALGRLGQFRTGAVTGDQRNLMCHQSSRQKEAGKTGGYLQPKGEVGKSVKLTNGLESVKGPTSALRRTDGNVRCGREVAAGKSRG